MSAIASTSSFSPLTRLENQLSSDVSSGSISSDDQSALSSALSDITSQLQTPGAGSGPPAPGAIQAQISGLIQGEVSSGKLTAAQGQELQQVFTQAFQGHHGGHHHAKAAGDGDSSQGASATGGTTDATDTTDSSSAGAGSTSSASSTDPTASTDQSSSASDVNQLMQDFLKSVQDSQNANSQSYSGTGGSDTLTAQVSSLVVNYQA